MDDSSSAHIVSTLRSHSSKILPKDSSSTIAWLMEAIQDNFCDSASHSAARLKRIPEAARRSVNMN